MNAGLFGQSLVNAILLSGMLTIVALGFSLVWGVLNIINLVHGAIIMLGSYLTYWIFTLWGVDPFLSIPIIMLVTFAYGYLLQRLVINQVIRAPLLVTFLLTFGVEIIMINLALYFWKADLRAITTAYSGMSLVLFQDPATGMGIQVPYVKIGVLVISLLLVLGLHFLMAHTRLGRAIRATGMDKDAAQLTGVKVAPIYAMTFALGSAMAGAAGVLIAMTQPITPGMGGSFTLRAFVIVVLGGLGSIPAVVIGAVLFAIVETLAGLFVPSLTSAVAFAFLVIILILRPQGIAGKAFYQ